MRYKTLYLVQKPSIMHYICFISKELSAKEHICIVAFYHYRTIKSFTIRTIKNFYTINGIRTKIIEQ